MENHIEVPVKNNDRGFTLVELLIVIVILGILSTVTVFAVRGITSTGRTNSCAVDRKIIDTSVEAYMAQWGVTAIAQTDATAVARPAGATWTEGATAEQTLVAAGFLKALSVNYDVDSAGTITGQTGNTNGCT